MVTEKEKKHVDLLPNGYKIVRQSLVDDLEGEKKGMLGDRNFAG